MKKLAKTLKASLASVLALCCVLTSIPAISVAADDTVITQTDYVCISEGTKYKVSTDATEDYDDPYMTDLTDGNFATLDYYNSGWVGYMNKDMDITIDLGELKEFRGAKGFFYCGGGGICGNKDMTIQYSVDGLEWFVLDTDRVGETDHAVAHNAIEEVSVEADEPVEAQFVKFRLLSASGWTFICELQVFADVPSAPKVPVITEGEFFTNSLTVRETEGFSLEVTAESNDNGVLSYQWYENGQPIGGNSNKLTVNDITLSHSGRVYWVTVTNTLNGMTETAISKMCMLNVVSKDKNPAYPVINSDLSATKTIVANSELQLSVAATVADSGTLTYQWYKNDVKIANATSNSYIIPVAKVADSGEYKVIVTSTLYGLKRRVTSTVCDVTVDPYYGENLIADIPYDTNISDEQYHEDYTDDSHLKLTDGVNSDYVGLGMNDGAVTLTFVADEVKTFKEINFSFYDEGEDVELPGFVQVEVYKDFEWSALYKEVIENKDKKDFVLNLESGSFSASAFRFSFADFDGYVFLDEIGVYAEKTGFTTTGTMKGAGDNNMVKGAGYELTAAPAGSYPDTGNAELTNGLLGGSNMYSSDYVGFSGVSEVGVIFDLGYASTFEAISFSALQDLRPGIYTPEKFRVEISNDKNNWTKVGEGKVPKPASNGVCVHSYNLPNAATTRYVKVVVSCGGWLFLGEVEILRNAASASGGVENLLSLGKEYTLDASVLPEFPEGTEILKLTDGHKTAEDVRSNTWLGFEGDASVVVDLGASKDFEQVTARFLSNIDKGYYFPESVSISVSDDNVTWTSAGTADVVADSEGVFNFDMLVAENTSGQYVKFSFASDEKFLVNEICVFENQEIFPVREPEGYYKDENNIALDASYETSWEADGTYPDTDNKELTDGVRGTYLYADSSWSAYAEKENEKFSVTVDLGDVKSFEQIQLGLLHSKSSKINIKYPIKILIEYSSDGEKWNVLLEEIPEFYEGTGVKRENYFCDISAQYVRFTFTQDGLLFLDEIAIYEKEVEGIDYEITPDSGATLNFARGKEYTVSRPAEYNQVMGLLTDGLVGETGSLFDKNWTGFKKSDDVSQNTVSIDFDLGSKNSVSSVIISSSNNSKFNDVTPKNVRIATSLDGLNWRDFGTIDDVTAEGLQELTWNGETDEIIDYPGYNMVYTRYVRITFDVPEDADDYAYLDEIKILGKRGECSTAVEIEVKDGEYNLVLGKPYKSTPKHYNAQCDDGTKLTDGIEGDVKDPSDPAWVLFTESIPPSGKQSDRARIQSVVFDFGETKSVTKVDARFLSSGFGSDSEYPCCVWTYASNDGINWYKIYDRDWDVVGRVWWSGNMRMGWRTGKGKDYIPGATAIQAKYIRVDFELLRRNKLDEIKVMGYDGIIEGSVPIDENNTRFLGDPADFNDPTKYGQDYLRPGADTAGIHDMLLIYNQDSEYNKYGERVWTAEKFRPLITYVGTDGEVKDTLFDAVCFLAISSVSGRVFNSVVGGGYEPIQFSDWQWYIDRLFKEGGDLDELNKAAKRASEELGDPDYKIKATIMFPGIDLNRTPTNFGPIDGEYYNLTKTAAWQFATRWWFDEVLEGFNSGNYDYIEFSGYYMFDEQVGFQTKYIQYANDYCHELGYKMFWIPFSDVNGTMWSRDLGFDAVAYQPNHFFGDGADPTDVSALDRDYLDHIAYLIHYGQVGLEMEMDGRLTTDVVRYNVGLDYFNGAYDNGMDGDKCYRAWYAGGSNMYDFAISTQPDVRNIYEYTYQLMNGTYTPKEYLTEFSTATIENKTFDSNFEIQSKPSAGSTGGGGAYKEPDNSVVAPETAKPSDEGYTWFTGTNGYKLKDSEGNYVTGWVKVNNDWYYLDNSGYMVTGWVKSDNTWYYLKANGKMATGWQFIDNAWYYLKDSGAMATGWIKDNNLWYYLKSNGAMAKNAWAEVDGEWYYFLNSGAMATGWVKSGNYWYYLKDSGAMATGWQLIKGEWYYLLPSNGQMAANTTVDGYKLNSSGVWVR